LYLRHLILRKFIDGELWNRFVTLIDRFSEQSMILFSHKMLAKPLDFVEMSNILKDIKAALLEAQKPKF